MRKLIVCLLAALLFTNPLFAAQKVDINHADAAALEAGLSGIGPVKAQAIVDYRANHGPFASPDDLVNVTGIGPSTVKAIREQLLFDTGSGTE